MRTAVYLTLAVVAAALFASAAARGVSPFCNTADDKVLCGQLVGRRARNWEEAMTNALNAVKKQAAAGKSVADVVAAKTPANLQPQTKESIVKGCYDAYDNVMYNIDECLAFAKDDPTRAMKYYLSAISFFDCTEGLREFNLTVPEATQYDAELLKLTGALLAVAEKKP